MLSPRKIPRPVYEPALGFLSNRFKSLVIYFVYLTNHLTNIHIRYTLSPFRLWKVSTTTLIQLSTKRCSKVIVLLYAAETERVQSLMRTLARTNFKSI